MWLIEGIIVEPANGGSLQERYMIVNDEKRKFSFAHQRRKYEHQLVSALITKNRLPKEYVQTIITGIQNNIKILPKIESDRQGFGIVFSQDSILRIAQRPLY